jgi:hypothetical protein
LFKRILGFVVFASVLLTGSAGGAAHAAYAALSGSVTASYSSTPTSSSASPALTVEATGVYLSSQTHKSNIIEVMPTAGAGYIATWASNGWVNKAGCPTNWRAPSSTLADCGVGAVYIDNVLVDPTLLKVSSQSTTSGTDYPPLNSNNIPGTVFIEMVQPNYWVDSYVQAGDVRVEMLAGAWDLSASASSSPHWQIFMFGAGGNGGTTGRAIMAVKAVTFDPNTGIGTKYSQTKTTNIAFALSANEFTKTDYSFTGWNTAPDGSGTSYADGAAYPFAVSDVLYAQWTANSGGGGSGGGGSGGGGSGEEDALAVTGANSGMALGALALALATLVGAIAIRRRARV